MPLGDQTGPLGMGPRTGRGMGGCPDMSSEEETKCQTLKHLLQEELASEEKAGEEYKEFSAYAAKVGLLKLSDTLFLISEDEVRHKVTLQKIVNELEMCCPDR